MRRAFLRLCVFPALFAASAAPAQTTDAAPERWRAMVGCWDEGGGEVLALDSIPFLGWFSTNVEGGRIVRTTTLERENQAYWRMTAPDSVEVVWNAGTHGSRREFRVVGDSLLAGRLHTDTDIVMRRPPPVLRVAARRVACPPDAAFGAPLPDSAGIAHRYAYAAVLPPRARIDADPWRAVAPMTAWLRAHPEVLSDAVVRGNARILYMLAANADARRAAGEFAGTYRIEMSRAGGPVHVFYARSADVADQATLVRDTATIVLEHAPGLRLPLALALDSAALPGPGLLRGKVRSVYGGQGPRNGYVDVRLPGVAAAEGSQRFAGYLLTLNFSSIFLDDDPALREADYAWYRENARMDASPDAAAIVVTPDGRITLTQTMVYAPGGGAITLRAERISRDTWSCPPAGCRW